MGVGKFSDGLGVGQRSVGNPDQGLLDGVIRIGEVDNLVAVFGDRVLLNVEVVVLLTCSDGFIKARPNPDDLAEPELSSDLINQRTFESVAGIGVVVFHPRWVHGLTGGNGQHTLLLQRNGRAAGSTDRIAGRGIAGVLCDRRVRGFGSCGGRVAVISVVVAVAIAAGADEQGED